VIIWSALLLIRFLIACLVIAFLPGFAFQLMLFPRATFDRAERAFLIISTSVTISSLVAVALLWTPGGLQAWSFGLVIIVVTVLLGVGAVVRHGGRHAFRTTLRNATQMVVGLPRALISSRGSIELPLFLVALVVLVGAASMRGESSTRVTEFYFPPEQWSTLMAQLQQTQAQLEIPFEIGNGAAQPDVFRVEVWSNGAKLAERVDITVEAEATEQAKVVVPATDNTDAHALELRLYNSVQSDPVAQLRLGRGVESSENTAQQ
jgi:uncharacterized membrane protein